MKKKLFFCTLGFFAIIPSVSALSENVVGSWATHSEGIVSKEVEESNKNRVNLENSLYDADAISNSSSDTTFTGIGYFGEEGVTYYFDKYDENGDKTHHSKLVRNPDATGADLIFREVTWGNTWIGEGVKVYAINYNGTGEDKLIAYAYNKMAYARAEAKGEILPQVEGADVTFENVEGNTDLYDTLVNFGSDFEYCTAIKLVDITEDLKYLGGSGQDSKDGYDLDAIYGYKILYAPVGEITYKDETAISVGDLNINCSDSWQKAVMKVKVSELLEQDKTFDIIAGQFYKIGTGRIYLENDIVKVDYKFYSFYDIKGIESAKVGIYKKLDSMMKNDKLLGNGKLVKDEQVSINDEYAYIRLHFDVSIPEYLYDSLEKIENIDAVCEIEEVDKETCDKEHSNKHCNKCHKDCNKHDNDKCDKNDSCKHKHDKDKYDKNNKDEHKKPCDKIVHKIKKTKKDCHKVIKNCSKKVYKTCKKIFS